MACKYNYKGKNYTEKQFRSHVESKILNSKNLNSPEFLSALAEIRANKLSDSDIKEILANEVVYMNEDNKPCAEMGLRNTLFGTGWAIVKDFKGAPKHSQGGVDISIGEQGVSMARGGSTIKAADGLVLPYSEPENQEIDLEDDFIDGTGNPKTSNIFGPSIPMMSPEMQADIVERNKRMQDYINSDAFAARAYNFASNSVQNNPKKLNKFIEKAKQDALANIQADVNVGEVSGDAAGEYKYYDQTIDLNSDYPKDLGQIYGHEVIHAMQDELNEIEKGKDYLYDFLQPLEELDQNSGVYADMKKAEADRDYYVTSSLKELPAYAVTVRSYLENYFKLNFGDNITPEMYEKFRDEVLKDPGKNKFLTTQIQYLEALIKSTDGKAFDNISDIMNKYVSNDKSKNTGGNPSNQPIQTAQFGGSINLNYLKSRMNPKNWGVTDYTDKGSRGAAFAAARKAGEKEFMWNNQRFNTKYDGTSEQQLKETGITDKQMLKSNIVRDRMENNIYDFEYHTKNPIVKMKNVVLDNKKEEHRLNDIGEIRENSKTHKDLLSLYLGKPQKYNTMSISKYIPSDSKEKDKEYFSVNSEEFKDYIFKHLNEDFITQGIKSGEINPARDKNGEVIPNRYTIKDIGTGLGEFTIDRGKDENGEYISYWDRWDLNPYKGAYADKDISNIEDLSFGIGKPYNIYDRLYFRENPDRDKYKEYDAKIDELWGLAKKTRDRKYIDEVNNLYDIRNSYHKKQNKYARQYYSDRELSELDINKKNFDTLALQRELSNRGYKLPKSTKQDGSLDGALGEETKKALLDYQIKNLAR